MASKGREGEVKVAVTMDGQLPYLFGLDQVVYPFDAEQIKCSVGSRVDKESEYKSQGRRLLWINLLFSTDNTNDMSMSCSKLVFSFFHSTDLTAILID